VTKKNPVVAAVLNFFLFGGGTIYVGRRRGFGLAMLLGGSLAQAIEIKLSPAFDGTIPTLWPFLLGGLVLMKLALAADGYREAKQVG
jgi:hypothetical protein